MPLKLSPTQVAFNARDDGKFNKPFTEQVDFFQQKLNLPTERFDDILKDAHDRAFVVAGAMKADLLNDLRQAVDRSIAEGKSIQWFRKEFDNIVAKHGWTGWTGEGTKAGRDWRTRVIYRTNLSTSYAAGRWQQLNDPDLLKRRPYWKYIHNDTVQHPRPLHQSWSGMVLKHDDPFWQTHFPPNGWGCRCRVTSVSTSEYKGHPAPDDGTYIYKSKDGTEHVLPKGIDYGWDYAPGASLSESIKPVVAPKVATLPKPLAEALQKDLSSVVSRPSPASLDEFIAAGRAKTEAIMQAAGESAQGFRRELLRQLAAEVGTADTVAVKVYGTRNGAARAVEKASQMLPNSWTQAMDGFGQLQVRQTAGRAFQKSLAGDYSGRLLNLKRLGFGIQPGSKNPGFIATRAGNIATALHELLHRMQAADPKLDGLFQALHDRRTAGDKLQRLRDIYPQFNYRNDEVAREDHYIHAYFGKVYNQGALEVMTMAIDSVMARVDPLIPNSEAPFKDLLERDRELFDLVIGVLFYYAP